MKRFIALLIISCTLLTGCHQYVYKCTKVTGTVTSMEHKDSELVSELYHDVATRTLRTRERTEPEHNYVTVSYEDIVETFDNSELFDTLKVGDSIELNLCQTFDEDNNLVYEELELIE